MGRWLLRRSIQAAVTFVVAVTLLFFLMRLAPGDPLWRLQEGEMLTPEARAVLERLYGMDRPPLEQFWTFLRG
ncbi:MAG: ABC transporter permease, partial [Gemmatimonadales bacterium]|nr:ABC transporter permease [Gemmatimonadales bacterium]